jgi:hypothetical protein
MTYHPPRSDWRKTWRDAKGKSLNFFQKLTFRKDLGKELDKLYQLIQDYERAPEGSAKKSQAGLIGIQAQLCSGVIDDYKAKARGFKDKTATPLEAALDSIQRDLRDYFNIQVH